MNARVLGLICIPILLFLLAFHSARTYPVLSLNDCMEDPDAYDEQIVSWYNEPMIGEIYNDGFLLVQGQGPSIRVLADTAGLIPGKFIGMVSVFHEEGYLESKKLVVARNRRYKIWLSVIPVFIVGFLLLKTIRINWKKGNLELKDDA